MSFFDSPENVADYIRLADGYDGRELIENLKKYVAPGSRILELGMGPGKDLDILNETFKTTGSDSSKVFLDLYREQHPDADLLQIDAIKMTTTRSFDCIYSNKVLHHLTRDELKQSFARQSDILSDNGILFHSFWFGDKEEEHIGLRFVYYTKGTLLETIGDSFEILKIEQYSEMDDDDSFYVVLKKN